MPRFKSTGIRKLLEARVQEASATLSGNEARLAGGERFVQDIREQLGLMVRSNPGDPESPLVESLDEYDRPVLAEGGLNPATFSIGELAEAICGREWVQALDPQNGNSGLFRLTEAAIDPTAMINVSVLSASVAGMVEAKILERWKYHQFVGDRLVEVIPSRKNGEKFIGAGSLPADAGDQSRKPGMPHARAQFGERYVTTPETDEKGIAVEVLKETVFFDRTNQVLQEAGEVGEVLGYGKEKQILQGVSGITNSYNYNGTAYDTYQATTPWINSHDNALTDYDNLDKSIELFNKMTNPENGREVMVDANQILHVPRRRSKWESVLYPNFIRTVTNTSTTTETNRISSTNRQYDMIESQILYNLLVASGVDSTKALDYWFHGDFKGAFGWVENWPLTVTQAVASDYAMRDRGIIFANLANHRGVFVVKEPRKAVRNLKA